MCNNRFSIPRLLGTSYLPFPILVPFQWQRKAMGNIEEIFAFALCKQTLTLHR